MRETHAVVCECGWRATLDPSRPSDVAVLADELAGAHLRDSPSCDEPELETARRVPLPRIKRPVPATA
jgi:hypothetical protein